MGPGLYYPLTPSILLNTGKENVSYTCFLFLWVNDYPVVSQCTCVCQLVQVASREFGCIILFALAFSVRINIFTLYVRLGCLPAGGSLCKVVNGVVNMQEAE